MRKSSGEKIYNWGIPAYRSASGFATCPQAGNCVAGCYARAGGYIFSNVAKVFEKRLALSKSKQFVDVIDAEIKRRKITRVRIHDSGDFYNIQYLNKWIEIIYKNPTVQFYAYTKMVSMIKGYIDLDSYKFMVYPINFTIIYSYGGKEDHLINPEIDRHSKVFSSVQDLCQAGYADCSQDDTVATGPNHRIGLVYHGTKSYKNTNWQKSLESSVLNDQVSMNTTAHVNTSKSIDGPIKRNETCSNSFSNPKNTLAPSMPSRVVNYFKKTLANLF